MKLPALIFNGSEKTGHRYGQPGTGGYHVKGYLSVGDYL